MRSTRTNTANKKLPRSFYARPTLEVAKALLGKRLVRVVGKQRLSGLIVETEAYMGPADVASHARFGPTSKAAAMFGEPGHAYVYFTYGMHYCMNVVTEGTGSGTAVLLRAVEPVEGQPTMRRHRLKQNAHLSDVADRELTSGPAKLCQALAIGRELNNADLLGYQLWIEDQPPVPSKDIGRTSRVGIRRGREHKWRFFIKGSGHVSRHPNYTN